MVAASRMSSIAGYQLFEQFEGENDTLGLAMTAEYHGGGGHALAPEAGHGLG